VVTKAEFLFDLLPVINLIKLDINFLIQNNEFIIFIGSFI